MEVPAGGALSLCPCATDDSIMTAAANCSAAGSMVNVDGADLTMELCKGGSCEEHVDRCALYYCRSSCSYGCSSAR